VKSPVPWNGLCFVHARANDVDEYEHADGHHIGYLRHSKSQDIWLASLRGAVATVAREKSEPAWKVADQDIARRALDEALAKLRARVAADRQWLELIDGEIAGNHWEAKPCT
jgi:hypothetical protein